MVLGGTFHIELPFAPLKATCWKESYAFDQTHFYSLLSVYVVKLWRVYCLCGALLERISFVRSFSTEKIPNC